MISSFGIARLPRIIFGGGSIKQLPELIAGYGHTVLIITAGFFQESAAWQTLKNDLSHRHIRVETCAVRGEPSPQLVDDYVRQFKDSDIDIVVGIGGGSVLDAGKAIAGLLKVQRTVMDYLEGVGPEMDYQGPAAPFIACPTTAGTGSEATKNAVLSQHGPEGFKKSFRDDQLVPVIALVDPELLASCPRGLIAANGMDCFTQLIESYVSTRSNLYTDSLILGALKDARKVFMDWVDDTENAAEGRNAMAYAALISGVCLAQTGLGSVHGLASPLGAFHPIPHGVACGCLMAVATETNIAAMKKREPNNPALDKYATLGRLMAGNSHLKTAEAQDALVGILNNWSKRLRLPGLTDFGIKESDIPRLVAHCRGSSMQTNPIVLTDEEVASMLEQRLD